MCEACIKVGSQDFESVILQGKMDSKFLEDAASYVVNFQSRIKAVNFLFLGHQ
jgi:hypothetical protein